MDQEVEVQEVDYLSATAGEVEQVGEVVILTVRPDRGSFRPHNISLTAEKARRLQSDLNHLFKNSRTLQRWKDKNPTAVVKTEDEV